MKIKQPIENLEKTIFTKNILIKQRIITLLVVCLFYSGMHAATKCIQSVTATGTQTLCQNSSANSITLNITSGSSGSPVSPTYQWYSNVNNNNTSGAMIAGATSSTYTPPTTTAGVVYYYCIVTNTNGGGTCSGGSNKSNTVTLTVNPLPNANAGTDKTLTCTTTSVILSGSSSTGGASFNWTTSGGNIVSGGSTATPTVNAAGTYVLTVTNPANGCTAKDTAIVILNNTIPNANAGTDKTLTCTTTSIILSGSSSTGGASFNWTTSGGNIVSGGSTATPTVNAAGTYVLTVTNPANGCTAKDTAIVILNNTIPNANAGTDKTLTCTTTSIILSGSSSTGGASFNWTTSGGNIVSGGSTATPTVNAAGTYVLTVANPANGCTEKDTAIVILNNSIPNANAGTDNTLTCTTTSVILSGSSSTGGASFNWTTTDGNIVSGGSTATPTVNAAGTYVLTVANPANGCTAKDTAIVILNNSIPNVNAGADTVINCIYTSIALNGSSQTSNVSFSWTTNNGNIVSGANTSNPIVNTGGSYILIITDIENGCMARDSVTVTINVDPPNANAGADTTLTCVVTQVALDGSSTTSGATFSWIASNGGAILSGANTATPLVIVPGTYILTVTNPVNGCTAQDSANVYQNINSPNVNAGANKTLTCTVTSIALSGSSSTGYTTYNWTTNDGNIVSGATTLAPTVNSSGTYVLTVIDTVNGCQASDVAEVTLNNTPPNVNAGADDTLTCTITSILLSGSSTTQGATFFWTTIGGNIVSGSSTATPTVNSVGSYVLTVTDTVNGCTATDTAIAILNNSIPNVNAGADTVICSNGEINLNGSSSANVEFNWVTIGGNIVSGANTANPLIDTAGIYILEATDRINGCTAKDSVSVTTLPEIVVNLGNDTSFTTCTHETITLDAGNQGMTFIWSTGATTQMITVSATGTYSVTVANQYGCTGTDMINVVIIDNSIDVNLGVDTTLCSCIVLSPGNFSGATFDWCSGQNYPSINVCTSGVYCVEVRTATCIVSDTIVVTINPPPVVDLGNDTTVINSIVLDAGNPGATYSWSNGATTQMIAVTTSGQYYVTVTDIYGCTASDTIMIDVIIGITENVATNFTVNVYPNPSNEKSFTVNFDVPETTNIEIRITNVLGRVVHLEKIKKFKGEYHKNITMENLSEGIYFVEVVRDMNRNISKIVLD